MGNKWIDKYSLLHFAVGIIAYYWSVSFMWTIGLHVLFEIIENTQKGMWFINNYITLWPGGKSHADSAINSISDIVFTIFGWLVSYSLEKYN